jgi:hypothetical protein
MTKYCAIHNVGNLHEIQKVLDFKCECFDDSHGCPLHDSRIGYFRRLNNKLSRIFEDSYNRSAL